MAHSITGEEPKTTNNRQWDRDEVVSNLIQFEQIRAKKSQRQAAMAAGLTDHVWSTSELLSHRVPATFLDQLQDLNRVHLGNRSFC